jgi:hypothetical protein
MPGDQTFNTLIGISRRVDGAVFVFSDDDKIWYRGDSAMQPRDNVLIEYGLFAGQLGQRKAIICRNGDPKQSTDLLGITFIDINEKRRSRAKQEVILWAKKLGSTPQDPALLRLEGRLAESERKREALEDELSFESEKARELSQLLTTQDIVDFANYDLSTDGPWKLLFQYRYFNEVANCLAKSTTSPIALKDLLESSNASEIVRQIAWHSAGDPLRLRADINPQRNLALARKALRIFRDYAKRNLYRVFIDTLPSAIQVKLEQIAEVAVATVDEMRGVS